MMHAVQEAIKTPRLRVAIVDDDENIRDAWSDPVLHLSYTPVSISESLPSSLEDVAPFFRHRADALLCDHRLSHVSEYSRFNGAPVVAECYKACMPALLCTRWNEASADEIRRHRQFIPVILSHEDSEDPDNIQRGFETCSREHRGLFSETRRPWRVLIRVEDLEFEEYDDDVRRGDEAFSQSRRVLDICFTIVGWQRRVLRMPFRDLPAEVRKEFLAGTRKFLHAEVNLGAGAVQDLYFSKWEPR